MTAEFYAGPLDGRTTESSAPLLVQPIMDEGRLFKATYKRTSPERYEYVGMEYVPPRRFD